MAPPNSSSFSVSVVLPASGWEMIAKVLLLLTSSANETIGMIQNSSMQRPQAAGIVEEIPGCLSRLLLQDAAQNRGIFTAGGRLVVSAPHAYLLESHGLVQAGRSQVRWPDLEERRVHAGAACTLDQVRQHSSSKTPGTIFLADAHIQNVRLARADGHDA